jgi:hypothetical protein
MGHKLAKGFDSLGRRARVEHNPDEPRENLVFDDNHG